MQLELNQMFKGKCLVASPTMRDDIFSETVVYITEHSSFNGAVGVVINKSIATEAKSAAEFGISLSHQGWSNIPVYWGGPVELSSGFILHQTSDNSNLFLTGSLDKIRKLAGDSRVKPLMLTAGYCMWETLQLEREVRFNNWLIVDGNPSQFLSDVPPQDRYQQALRLAGIHDLASFDFNGGGNA